jgi:hypothetical protein
VPAKKVTTVPPEPHKKLVNKLGGSL